MFLIDCGLIHKYLASKVGIEKIEAETFLTVRIIKDLTGYEVKGTDNKLIVYNGSEKLAFKKVSVDKYLQYMLNDFNF